MRSDVVLAFTYRSREGLSSLRRVRANSLHWAADPRYGGGVCLRAYDVDKDAWRSFLFSGISNVLTLEEPAASPAEASAYEEAAEAPPF